MPSVSILPTAKWGLPTANAVGNRRVFCSVEKRNGCNHMTCEAPCKFEFCWMCGEAWKGHSNYYNCNKYKKKREEKGKLDEDKRSREMAKRFLERYSHYYERWASNDKSRKIAMEDLKRAESRCVGKMQFV